MSATRIKTRNKTRVIKPSPNALLFETPLATLQAWIDNHEEMSQDGVPLLVKAMKDFENDFTVGEIAMAASIILAAYCDEVGESEQSNKCVRSYTDDYPAFTSAPIPREQAAEISAAVN
jgi:hypothetical protein